MRLYFFLVLLSLMTGVGTHSSLAQPWEKTFRIDVQASGTQALYSGGIYHGSVDALRSVLGAHPEIRLLGFNSGGGRTSVGRDLFFIIREHKLSTFVDTTCASACTLAFMGGKERLLGRDSKLGFHAATNTAHVSNPNRFGPADSFASQARTLAEIVGIDLAFVDYAYEMDPSGLFVPTVEVLVEAGFITGIDTGALDNDQVETSYNFVAGSFEFAAEALEEQRWADAASNLETSLEAMFPEAHFILAKLYADGLGVPRDPRRAALLYKVASDAGHPAASHNLGLMMLRGEGVIESADLGIFLVSRAADAGNVEAKYNLAQFYTVGRYVEQNHLEALRILTDCAEAGFYICQVELGNRYSTGKGAPLELQRARELYAEALRSMPSSDPMMAATQSQITWIDSQIGR